MKRLILHRINFYLHLVYRAINMFSLTYFSIVKSFLIVSIFLAASAQNTDIPDINTAGKPGVYAVPEIKIKLNNGSVLEAEPNSPVVLPMELGHVELSCTADYPVKWEYRMKNTTIPTLDIIYRRLKRNDTDFDNPKGNRFMAVVYLQGLLESQTGKYLCRHYNEKFSNNSYAVSSYFDIFVPGNRTFNTITNIAFHNKSAPLPFVDIHCPVSNPALHVRLYKLNEQYFNKTREVSWKPIYANYEPTDGFRLHAGLGRELLGTYNCSADNGASVISIVADLSEQALYHSSSPSIPIKSCWKNFNFVQYLRSQRLECFCKDSYGLFMNDNYEFENRQASCSSEYLYNQFKNCSDWRLEEFFGNKEESSNVCFREPIHADGSGSRPSLKVKGETFPNGNAQHNFSFTKLSVTYNGFVDWAGDFMLGICRKDKCRVSRNKFNNDSSSDLEYVEREPSSVQYFPLANQQAVWKDVVVKGTDVKLVYIFQAHSLSYAWFPYGTKEIQWGKTDKGNEDGVPSYEQMTSSSSSRLNYYLSSFYCILMYLGLVIHKN